MRYKVLRPWKRHEFTLRLPFDSHLSHSETFTGLTLRFFKWVLSSHGAEKSQARQAEMGCGSIH